jgi:serine/threonine protein kinase
LRKWNAARSERRMTDHNSQIDQPNAPTNTYVTPSEAPGTKIDQYKLLEQIGEGGFGAVFMAEQEFPIRRRVALKIIKLGMDTKQVVARFEAERQALAMMDHPNIARVLDGGSTTAGRPYFVMELVRGIPITAYCDKNKLAIQKRLELFAQVCQAVQHAHQKGLIHRDLKPSNVLVSTQDDQPRAKVIDFGIAKATQAHLTEKTLFTQFHEMIGTPAYMSPEQADGDLDIDTRSDVYSLGVLLYELLAGATPFDARELCSNYAEMQRIIREVEPPPPSTRLSTLRDTLPSIAAHRDVEPGKLKTILRGELDWIVMRSLEKDRKRRYQSASELNEDIQRYLNDESVKARPATRMYRVRKFVRRNKPSVIAASAVVLALVAGLGLATFGFFRARHERDRAEAATALANDNFLQARAAVEDLLQISNQRLKDQPGMQPLCMELMKAAIDRYEPFLAKPISDPTPRAELARLYAQYGLLMLEGSEVFDQRVMATFEKARTIQEQLLQEHPGDRALRSDLGWTLVLETWRDHDVPPPPAQTGMQAIEVFRKLLAEDPSDPFARDDLMWSLYIYARLHRGGDPLPHAMALSNEAVAIGDQLVREYPVSAEFRRDLANALELNGLLVLGSNPTVADAEKALPIYRRIMELRQAILADLMANRPDALQPRRPSQSEGGIFQPSVLYAKSDIGWAFFLGARAYRAMHDWQNLALISDQSALIWKDAVEHNPAVANFANSLADVLQTRIDAAQQANDRRAVAASSRDAVEFWKQQADLHPEVPFLRQYAEHAVKADAQLADWLAQSPSTQR